MLQGEFFEVSRPGNKFMGAGCCGVVHSLDDSWVIKCSRNRDSTLNYLEWCKLMQDAGKGMAAMPVIDRIAHTEYGYIVTMERLEEQSENKLSWGAALAIPHMEDMVYEYREYSERTFAWLFPGVGRNGLNDIHEGNFMMRGDVLVMTDPSSDEYKRTNKRCVLVLH